MNGSLITSWYGAPFSGRARQRRSVGHQWQSAVCATVGKKRAGKMPQAKMVAYLKRWQRVVTPSVEAALLAVDRRWYVPPEFSNAEAYADKPLQLGLGETISAPHMHASCLELLAPVLRPGARVLDVGSGSGYLSAALAVMVGPTGRVFGIEEHKLLAVTSIVSIRRSNPELLEGKDARVVIRHGNALDLVQEETRGYNAIHVGAAAESMPWELIDRLLPGGMMVVPVNSAHDSQTLERVVKDTSGKVYTEPFCSVRFVPLTPATRKSRKADTEACC